MVEHTGRKSRFLDHRIARDDRPHPAHVDRIGAHGAAAEDEAAIGGIVGDRIDEDARLLCFRIRADDPAVENFQRRHDIIRGVQDLDDVDPRAFEPGFHDERDLRFDPWLDEAIGGYACAVVEQHVVEEHAGIGRVDAERLLHGIGRQPDLPADDAVAVVAFAPDQSRLDRIGVVDRHFGMLEREEPDLFSIAFGLMQAFGGLGDLGCIQHGAPDFSVLKDTPRSDPARAPSLGDQIG